MNWRFILSLGTTQIFDAIANAASEQLGTAGKIVALIMDLIVTGVFALLGFLAGKKHLWAFILGMVLFGLDGLVLLVLQDWIGVVFHALVLFWLVRGYMAGRELMSLERELAQQPPAPVQLQTPAPSA
ncbi:MAG: hypothetical protein ABR555_12680 [Pyrinomonadaceae bacterium]